LFFRIFWDIRPDTVSQYPAFSFAGYPAKSLSGASIVGLYPNFYIAPKKRKKLFILAVETDAH
jgi:hypothetical protein